MNRKSLAFSLAIAAMAGSSFAESYTQHNTPFVSSATRTEVAAQVAQPVNPWSISYNPLAQFRSSKTRAQVTAEYIVDRDVVNAFTGEDSGSSYLAGGAVGTDDRLAGQPAAAH